MTATQYDDWYDSRNGVFALTSYADNELSLHPPLSIIGASAASKALHPQRRTKATLIYRRTRNLRAVLLKIAIQRLGLT